MQIGKLREVFLLALSTKEYQEKLTYSEAPLQEPGIREANSPDSVHTSEGCQQKSSLYDGFNLYGSAARTRRPPV
ncbi:Hypothetical predicted protein [Podarcis lilfordi]|uniref:Uncharacterized protein n=1 Tax=Podarcis lilfordi TaxID=74358 RepID=A0AA35KUN5_9SAUR|nr:Hypothetical predicted protein [Podarcis lilfordi]